MQGSGLVEEAYECNPTFPFRRGKKEIRRWAGCNSGFYPHPSCGRRRADGEQLREFLQMAEGLVLYKGKWVEINRKKLEAALSALEKAKEAAGDGTVSLAEAMRLELGLQENRSGEDAPEVVVTNGEWLRKVREMLTKPATIEPIHTEPTFHAGLRGYQEGDSGRRDT